MNSSYNKLKEEYEIMYNELDPKLSNYDVLLEFCLRKISQLEQEIAYLKSKDIKFKGPIL